MTANNPDSRLSNAAAGAHIAAVAVASPPYAVDQAQADAFLTEHYADRLSPRNQALMHKILEHPSVRKRNFALDDPACLIDEDPDARIARFTQWAITLSARAVSDALAQAGLTPGDVSALVVNTCTGYICPGLSTYLIETLGLARTIRAFDLVGSGCGGAVPNLQVAELLLNGSEGVVVSVSTEICSATFQMADELSPIISNAIFADGAAACVLWKKPVGLALIDSAGLFAPEHRDDIRYIHRQGQLYNQITSRLPHLVKRAAASVVKDLLEPRSLRVEDIGHWALHPGGEKIINAVKGELGLSEEQLRPTRSVFAEFGNMSSPTVWFVLREILDAGIAPGEWCVMLAFGAGLSAHAYLLRKKPL